jgi:hypothetical protein
MPVNLRTCPRISWFGRGSEASPTRSGTPLRNLRNGAPNACHASILPVFRTAVLALPNFVEKAAMRLSCVSPNSEPAYRLTPNPPPPPLRRPVRHSPHRLQDKPEPPKALQRRQTVARFSALGLPFGPNIRTRLFSGVPVRRLSAAYPNGTIDRLPDQAACRPEFACQEHGDGPLQRDAQLSAERTIATRSPDWTFC